MVAGGRFHRVTYMGLLCCISLTQYPILPKGIDWTLYVHWRLCNCARLGEFLLPLLMTAGGIDVVRKLAIASCSGSFCRYTVHWTGMTTYDCNWPMVVEHFTGFNIARAWLPESNAISVRGLPLNLHDPDWRKRAVT